MEALIYLTNLSLVLLVGLICSYIAEKLKIPNMLLLLLVGLFLSTLKYNGDPLISFPDVFLTSMAILALVMIVFDGSSRFKWKEFDSLSIMALKLVLTNLVLNLVFISFFLYAFFNIISFYYSLIFAALITATAPDVVMFMMKDATDQKSVALLKIEAIINTPIIVLMPFLFLDLMQRVGTHLILSGFISQIGNFLQQVITGIGAGVLIGIIIFKLMRELYSEPMSPLILTAGALLSYVLAENLGGNGVLAVTTLGIVFGNVYVKQKMHLQEFSSLLSSFLEVLVFVMIGFMIKINFSILFILKSIALFVLYLLIRYLSMVLALRKTKFNPKEVLFMTLNSPKGIAVATVVFMLISLNLPGIEVVNNLLVLMLLYSIITATFAVKYSKLFIREKLIK